MESSISLQATECSLARLLLFRPMRLHDWTGKLLREILLGSTLCNDDLQRTKMMAMRWRLLGNLATNHARSEQSRRNVSISRVQEREWDERQLVGYTIWPETHLSIQRVEGRGKWEFLSHEITQCAVRLPSTFSYAASLAPFPKHLVCNFASKLHCKKGTNESKCHATFFVA